MARPAELIAVAVRNLEREVPALAPLKLVVRLELRGRGDVQVFRVRLPGPEVTKGEPEDARLEIALNAVRIHGGYGYSTEFDVERYFRDAPLMIVGEGTNEIQRNVIAAQLVARGL